jgi:TP901 family phage tail tape measure protein
MADKNSMISRSFGKVNQSINRVAMIGLTALIATFGLATKNYIAFQSAMAKVETIADSTTMSFEMQRKKLLDLSSSLGIPALELAEAQYQAISAGVTDSAKALDFVALSAKAAVGGFTETATAVDGLTSILNAYEMSVDNATKISDQMFATQNFGKTTFDEMAQSMGGTIPIASALGVTTDQLFGSIAALTKVGVQTPEAFVGVKAALSNIIKPSEQASKLAKKLGLDFSAAALKTKGFQKFLEDASDATGGSSEKMAQLFGSVRALNTVLALTKNGSKVFKDSIEAVQNSAGATDRAFEKMTSTLGFRFEKMKVKLDNTLTKIGDSISPLVNKILDEFDKIDLEAVISKIQNIDLNPIIKVFDGLKKGIGFLAKNWKILLAFAGGIKAVSIAMGILTIATQVFGKALTATPVGMIITAVFALGAAIVWMALNWDKVTSALKIAWTWVANVGQKFMFLLGPIGFLVSGIIEIVKSLGKIKDAFSTEGFVAGMYAIAEAFNRGLMIPVQKAWELLKMFGAFMAEIFTPILKDIGAWFVEIGKAISEGFNFGINKALELIGFLIDKWGDLKTAFTDGSILSGILNIGKTILSALLAPIQAFLEMVSNIPGVGNLAKGGALKIEEIRNNLVDFKDNAPSTPQPTFPTAVNQNAETPRPSYDPDRPGGAGTLDININDKSNGGAEVKESRNMPIGTTVRYTPMFGN